MLLRAEDQADFRGQIEVSGAQVWASYSVKGKVKSEPMTQSDKRLFASEQEARSWLIAEAEERGFPAFEPEIRSSPVKP
jgi:hypothetical protein